MPIDIPNTGGFTGGAYKLPLNKDTGNEVFQTIEDFMTRMATHSHNNDDSVPISLNFTKHFQDLSAGTGIVWTSLGEGDYKGTVTLPAAANINNVREFYYLDSGNYIRFYPTIEPAVAADEYHIIMNDNSVDIRIVYF